MRSYFIRGLVIILTIGLLTIAGLGLFPIYRIVSCSVETGDFFNCYLKIEHEQDSPILKDGW